MKYKLIMALLFILSVNATDSDSNLKDTTVESKKNKKIEGTIDLLSAASYILQAYICYGLTSIAINNGDPLKSRWFGRTQQIYINGLNAVISSILFAYFANSAYKKLIETNTTKEEEKANA